MRILISAVALATAAFVSLAPAQDWPQRRHARGAVYRRRHHRHVRAILAQGLQQKFTTPFVVDNRAGAGGNIGAAMVARAAKDGHTLLVGTVSTHAINPFIYKNLAHDTEKDFQPVSLDARLPNMLVVHPKIPATTVAELTEHLKKNAGKLSYGSSGAGTSTHLAAELFQLKTGTKMVHVPYRSSGDVMNALIGGHIDLAFDNTRWLGRTPRPARSARSRSPARSRAPPRRRSRRLPPPWRASTRPPGMACSCPPARRARSSTRSPPR